MPVLSPDDLRKLMLETLKLINGDEKDLPKINESNDLAYPFIEIESYGYYYVIRERGIEIDRSLPFDETELLYLVFRNITMEMANKWGMRNRLAGQDTRRPYFAKHIELMSMISPEFGLKAKAEIDQILRVAPYHDNL